MSENSKPSKNTTHQSLYLGESTKLQEYSDLLYKSKVLDTLIELLGNKCLMCKEEEQEYVDNVDNNPRPPPKVRAEQLFDSFEITWFAHCKNCGYMCKRHCIPTTPKATCKRCGSME